jgi:hypothetical protein
VHRRNALRADDEPRHHVDSKQQVESPTIIDNSSFFFSQILPEANAAVYQAVDF